MPSQPPDMPHIANLPDSATAHFRKEGEPAIRSRSDLQQAFQTQAQAALETVAPIPTPSQPQSSSGSVGLPLEANKATPIEGKLPGTVNPKPMVLWGSSPNFSSRNGSKIESIWIHTAQTLNVQSAAAWYQDPASQISTHYLLAWSGQTYQLMPDDYAAWHLPGENHQSIGIDVCAIESQIMTLFQGAALKELVVWLSREYGILPENVKTDAEFMFAAVTDSFSDWILGALKLPNALLETDAVISSPLEVELLS